MPAPFAPPAEQPPYKFPSRPETRAADGLAPMGFSEFAFKAAKEYKELKAPAGVILKSAPLSVRARGGRRAVKIAVRSQGQRGGRQPAVVAARK